MTCSIVCGIFVVGLFYSFQFKFILLCMMILMRYEDYFLLVLFIFFMLLGSEIKLKMDNCLNEGSIKITL